MLQKVKTHHEIKRVMQEFAELAELVYFGDVDQIEVADLYKGVTYDPDSKITNYMHGTIRGYDTSVFNRKATHRNYHGEVSKNEWTILAVHLKSSSFPHIILDTRKHDKVFYDTVASRFPQLRRGNLMLQQLNPSSTQYFECYLEPNSALAALGLIDDMVLQTLAGQYAANDLELTNDKLFVFRRGSVQNVRIIQQLQEEALWLAELFEYRHAYMQGVQSTAVSN